MEKRNWNQNAGTGWMRDPKDNLWYYYEGFERTGKVQKNVIHSNPFKAVSYNVKKFQKWNKKKDKEFYDNLKKYQESQRAQGLVYDSGKWVPGPNYDEIQKQLKLKEKDELLKNTYKQVTEDDISEYLKIEKEGSTDNSNFLKINFDEQPLGTDLGIGNYMDFANLDINYVSPDNALKVDKGELPKNSMPSTKYANTAVGEYYTYKGKRYKKGSVGARKADRAMEAKLKAQEMARNRLRIQAENS